MGKVIGSVSLFVGIIGFLYSWVMEQKRQQQHMEEVLLFVQRSIYAMEGEKIRIIDYLENYDSRDTLLKDTLREIARRLRLHSFPDGRLVWETVFMEKQLSFGMDEESFAIVLALGNGFFGRRREENASILRRSLRQLEEQGKRRKELDANARKLWIPVGMLGGIMLMIILI